MLAFLIDGTNMAISGFDKTKQDPGYAAVLECKSTQMASSHQIKRFFAKLSVIPNFISFGMNRAYYFMLVFAHFLFEAYKGANTIKRNMGRNHAPKPDVSPSAVWMITYWM